MQRKVQCFLLAHYVSADISRLFEVNLKSICGLGDIGCDMRVYYTTY